MSKANPEYKFSNSKKQRFINPYTFVPVRKFDHTSSKGIDPLESSNMLLTGVLTCHLHTKTPLIIPDTEHPKPNYEKKGHYYYPFIKISGKYTIPGSSIRGPVRNMYETLTDSCFSTMKDHQLITARTKAPFQAGVLFIRDNQYILVKADRYRIATKPDRNRPWVPKETLMQYGYGACIRFTGSMSTLKRNITVYDVEQIRGKVDNLSESSGRNCEERERNGFLFIGENIWGKSYESIFFCEKNPYKDDDYPSYCVEYGDAVKRAYQYLKNTVEVYQNDSVNRNLGKDHNGYRHIDFDGFENGNIPALPVWYCGEGDLLHFSTANIGRFTYNRTLNEIVPEQSRPCRDIQNACKACSLFGMVKKGKGEAEDESFDGAGSHIRFSDAKLLDSYNESTIKSFEMDQTLEELSSPKPSYIPFYVNVGNYRNGYDDLSAEIKGRKYYWHHKPILEENSGKSIDKTPRNATMQILKDPAEFEFFVYFDSITETQLLELECVLTLGENEKDGNLCYKIGHGKPLGYGSAKITIDRCMLREYKEGVYSLEKKEQKDISVRSVEEVFSEWPGGLNYIVDFSFTEKLADFIEYGIHYPIVHNGTGVPDREIQEMNSNALPPHNWFGENFPLGMNTPKYSLKAPFDYRDQDKKEIQSQIALPVIDLVDMTIKGKSVLQETDNHKNSEPSYNTTGTNIIKNSQLERDQTITVVITGCKRDKDDPNYKFGFFTYGKMKGAIKHLPKNVNSGDTVKVRILDPRTSKGNIFTEYKK